jgi:hypothetical protein
MCGKLEVRNVSVKRLFWFEPDAIDPAERLKSQRK